MKKIILLLCVSYSLLFSKYTEYKNIDIVYIDKIAYERTSYITKNNKGDIVNIEESLKKVKNKKPNKNKKYK